MACMVMRCDKPVTDVLVVTPKGYPRFEAGLCDTHMQAIRAGEPWRYENSTSPDSLDLRAPSILMGDDLAARDLYELTDLSVVADVSFGPGGNSPPRFVLELARIGDRRLHKVEIQATAEAISMLRNSLEWASGMRPGSPGSPE